MEADDMLPSPDTAENAALDYAEQAFGRFYFRENWPRLRDPAKVAAWLEEFQYDCDPSQVVAELDRLAASGAWLS